MIRPTDILTNWQVLLCGGGLVADSLVSLFSLTYYRAHCREKILYLGEPEAGDYEWIEPVVPVAAYTYAFRDRAYRVSRTHSRLPLFLLALIQCIDGLIEMASLGFVFSALAEQFQFSAYWRDATEPCFRMNTAVVIQNEADFPVTTFIGVEKC